VKRLRRILFNALSVLSLLLCLATAGLWAQSYWAEPGLAFNRKGERCRICVIRGRLVEDNKPQRDDIARQMMGKAEGMLGTNPSDLTEAIVAEHRRLLQELEDLARQPSLRPWTRSTPWALPLTLLGTGTFSAITLKRRLAIRHRKQLGLCLHCGYDLRATPDRCPECGAVPAAKN